MYHFRKYGSFCIGLGLALLLAVNAAAGGNPNRVDDPDGTRIPDPTLPPNEDEADLAISGNVPSVVQLNSEFSAIYILSVTGERNATSGQFSSVIASGFDYRGVNVEPKLGECYFDGDQNSVICENIGIAQTQPVTVTVGLFAKTVGNYQNVATLNKLDARVVDKPGNNQVVSSIAVQDQPPTVTPTPLPTATPLPTDTPTPAATPTPGARDKLNFVPLIRR